MDRTWPSRLNLRSRPFRFGSGAGAHGADAAILGALDHAPVGLIVLDRKRRVARITAPARLLLRLPRQRIGAGMPVRHLLSGSALAEADANRIIAALESCGGDPRELLLDIAGAGETCVLAVDVRSVGRQGWVISLVDVTQSRQTQDWLLEHASSDPVTGLWNSHHFMLMLQDRLIATKPAHLPEKPFVLLIGLRHLQHVYELWNSTTFDLLLRQVGERLSRCLTDGDILARLPGDQFAVALVRAGGHEAVEQACADIAMALTRPFLLAGHGITLGVRIGIAGAPQDGVTPNELLGNAGLALVAADSDELPQIWRFFDAGLTERAQSRRAFEIDLRQALTRGEFELHYQPQLDLHRSRVTGLEALLRWRNPQRGLVPPVAFIGLAEELGLIEPIGGWVLAEACRAAATWPAHITVAVNASPLQFESGGFADTVAHALHAAGLPAHRLEIEVTENLLLRRTDSVTRTLAALQRLGVRLVLDDFGTGYASLSQLSRFHFDKIKIDRSFVSPIENSPQHIAIVRSIAALGQSLGIPTIAEGVENERQMEQIRADGCTCVQGYYLSRPVPGADVGSVIERLNQLQARLAA